MNLIRIVCLKIFADDQYCTTEIYFSKLSGSGCVAQLLQPTNEWEITLISTL